MYKPNIIYHVFNQGNNRQTTFFSSENYEYFLRKLIQHIVPYASILSYCLMPNHFHLQLVPNQSGLHLGNSPKPPGIGETEIALAKMQRLSEGFRNLLSSYTHAINKQEGRTGSLWRSGTKIKPGWGADDYLDYPYDPLLPFRGYLPYVIQCFYYIHANPSKAGLVTIDEDWPYSSAREYAGFDDRGLCDFAMAKKLLGINRVK